MTGALFGYVLLNTNTGVQALITAENLFYLEGSCPTTDRGVGMYGNVSEEECPTTAKTADEMTAPEFVSALNSNGAWKQGQTYPILICQPDEVTQGVAGDINNSGIVDENDLTMLIGHVLGTDPLSDPDQKTAADINGNGYIDENDATYLIQIILHL
jgi:hypothetical protein